MKYILGILIAITIISNSYSQIDCSKVKSFEGSGENAYYEYLLRNPDKIDRKEAFYELFDCLFQVKTFSGKTIHDFDISVEVFKKDIQIITLIILSHAMDDGERQYWFNLMDVMTEPQIEKLRQVLMNEVKKIEEVRNKYGDNPPIDPKVAAAQARKKAQERREKQLEQKRKDTINTASPNDSMYWIDSTYSEYLQERTGITIDKKNKLWTPSNIAIIIFLTLLVSFISILKFKRKI